MFDQFKYHRSAKLLTCVNFNYILETYPKLAAMFIRGLLLHHPNILHSTTEKVLRLLEWQNLNCHLFERLIPSGSNMDGTAIHMHHSTDLDLMYIIREECLEEINILKPSAHLNFQVDPTNPAFVKLLEVDRVGNQTIVDTA